MREQVKEMLANGIIEAASSHTSPSVLVHKKDGKYRLCVDFRRLNSDTEDSPQPILLIDEMLKELGVAGMSKTLAIKNIYWQILLTERSKPLTAFVTSDRGQYQYNVAAFRLENAGRNRNHFVGQEVLAGYQPKFVANFQDAMCILSPTWQQHLVHLALVLERLAIYGET